MHTQHTHIHTHIYIYTHIHAHNIHTAHTYIHTTHTYIHTTHTTQIHTTHTHTHTHTYTHLQYTEMPTPYNGYITLADAGESTDAPTTTGAGQAVASPQSGGIFRRTFSFRRRERQDSSSVASPAKEKEQQTPQKVSVFTCMRL